MPAEAMGHWWDGAKFGLFVHWGVFALPERGEWVMHREHIAAAEYARFAERFDARVWEPRELARLAKRAGMRYAILTARHHDGFALWDTATDDFKATSTPAGRDIVAEWLAAARGEGLHTGLYYSLLDWRDPAYWQGPEGDPPAWAAFREKVHAQVRELCTAYGAIEVLWYDGFWPWPAGAWRTAELNAEVRALQPGILINDRAGTHEDFTTPEQQISVLAPPGRWETCMTLNDNWGWHAGDTNWKPAAQLVRNLVQCAAGGGNYLVNVGPRPDGSIPEASIERLEAVGVWLTTNGASIYGTTRGRFLGHSHGAVTCAPGKLYLHCYQWPAEGSLVLAHLANRATAARLLATGEALRLVEREDVLTISGLPASMPDLLDTVVEVDVEGEPRVTPGGFIFWRGEAHF